MGNQQLPPLRSHDLTPGKKEPLDLMSQILGVVDGIRRDQQATQVVLERLEAQVANLCQRIAGVGIVSRSSRTAPP